MSYTTPVSIEGSIKILLIEDSLRMQESLRNGLQGIDSNLQFVGVTGNSRQAWEILQTTEINLVIMDYVLEKESLWGVELTKKIVIQFPDIKIIFCSAHTKPVDVKKAKDAGAHGYVPKESTDSEIKIAIDRVMRGEEVWIDSIETSPRIKLTEMEIKVMEQLAKGKSNQQIAIALLREEFLDKTGLEEGFPDRYETIGEYMDEVLDRYTRLESRTTTVQTHLVNIKNKYGGPSRGQLIRIAIENYGGLENKRPISPEEIAVLESLHYGVAPKQIARTLAISEIDVEKIRKKFDPEDINPFS